MLAIWTVVVNRKREGARLRRYFEGRADLIYKEKGMGEREESKHTFRLWM